MELWTVILISFSLCLVLSLLLNLLSNGQGKKKRRLPPGPPAVPILGNLLWLRRRSSFRDIETLLRGLHTRYGPIITLRFGSRVSIFIADRALAHTVLVEQGVDFADRPTPLAAGRLLPRNERNISDSAYGPFWRLLRRNLSSEILHHSRVKLFAHGRRWVLDVLLNKLRSIAEANDGVVVVIESFQFAMFCLLVLMCFGEKLDEGAIRDIEVAQREPLLYLNKLNVFEFLPHITRYIFRKRLLKVLEFKQRQKDLYARLIRARKEHKLKQQHTEERFVYSYVDSLLDIELPDECGRKLNDDEMVALSSEFLDAGTDTTSTALQWIMANLVKHQQIQRKLVEEIEGVVGGNAEQVEEEQLQSMPYLKAVVFESLRRHPPAHFVLPHAVTQEVTVGDYVIPRNASINFMVAEMNRDDKAWMEPMEFRPERFLAGGEGEGVDITGSREIKMMPFGVGRRICPGLGLAMLHLEYFVANLVWAFEWKPVDGEEIDLSEKLEFTVVMESPLRARTNPRRNG